MFRVFTEPQKGASYDQLLAVARTAERFSLQLLDLNDLDHLRLVAEQVMPHAAGI